MNNSKLKKSISLTDGNVWKALLLYSLPLFGSAMVQQLYSLVDLLIVGNFAKDGASAVAAIGNATVIVNILLSFALGANGGCSVIIAKHFGAKDSKRIKETFSTAIIAFSVLCGVIMLVGLLLSRVCLTALDVHQTYFDDCLAYLNIYIYSLPFVFLYNLGCGILSALGDSKTPFIFLVVSSILNIGLDLLFVLVLNLGVKGAAWATFISQAIASVLTGVVLLKRLGKIKSEEKPKLFDGLILKDLIVTSVPIIMQQSFVSVGNFFVGKCINNLGEDATTGFTTAFKLVCMANMGVGSMSNGLANFVSQNRACGNYQRIKQGFCVMLLYCLATSVIFLTLFVSMPEQFTLLFTEKSKLTDAALACSKQFLVIVSCFLPAVCTKIVADGGVRGSGGNLGFAISTFTDLILRVALVYLLTSIGWGFSGVCWAWSIGWSVSMFVALFFFFKVPYLKGVPYFKKQLDKEGMTELK